MYIFSRSKNITSSVLLIVALISGISFPLFQARALTVTPVKLEFKADPGQTIVKTVTLINDHDTQQTFYTSFANFEAQGETGTPTFIDPKDDLGTWMSGPDSVTLAASETKDVPIKIIVPKDADPGGHFAAVFFGTIPPNNVSNAVAIGAKTAILMLLTVNGSVSEEGGVIEFATKNKQTFYTSLPVTFYYRFQNNGGNRVKPAGDILMKNMFGLTSAKVPGNPVDGNILPKSVRKFETTWQGKDGPTPVDEKDQGNFFNKVKREWRNFAFGHYRADLALSYGEKNQVATASYSFWVFPWHLTVFVVVLAIVIIMLLRFLIRRYNKWVIGQAEAMLKREQASGMTNPQ